MARASTMGREDRSEAARAALARAWSVVYNYGLLVALIALAGVFSFLRPDTFPTIANAGSILTGSAALAMIAIGVTLPLIVQQFDLSAGFMATFAESARRRFAVLQSRSGMARDHRRLGGVRSGRPGQRASHRLR